VIINLLRCLRLLLLLEQVTLLVVVAAVVLLPCHPCCRVQRAILHLRRSFKPSSIKSRCSFYRACKNLLACCVRSQRRRSPSCTLRSLLLATTKIPHCRHRHRRTPPPTSASRSCNASINHSCSRSHARQRLQNVSRHSLLLLLPAGSTNNSVSRPAEPSHLSFSSPPRRL